MEIVNYYPELQGKINMERDIVNFRHRLMHGYFTVNDILVYSITKQDLPELMTEVEALQREFLR